MLTTEGIFYRAFVAKPAELKDNVSLCNGKSVKDWLKEKFDGGYHFGTDNLLHGIYRVGGWEFNLRPFMKKYIFTDYDSIRVCYAPSVAGLRRVCCLRRGERVALAPKGF